MPWASHTTSTPPSAPPRRERKRSTPSRVQTEYGAPGVERRATPRWQRFSRALPDGSAHFDSPRARDSALPTRPRSVSNNQQRIGSSFLGFRINPVPSDLRPLPCPSDARATGDVSSTIATSPLTPRRPTDILVNCVGRTARHSVSDHGRGATAARTAVVAKRSPQEK